jgi:hypothetical protein
MFSAYDVGFAANNPEFPFGIAHEKCAAELRTFADKLERGEVLLQKVRCSSYATRDDYPMTEMHLVVIIYEKHHGARQMVAGDL